MNYFVYLKDKEQQKINKLEKQARVQENFAWLVIAAFLLAVIIYSLPLSVLYP